MQEDGDELLGGQMRTRFCTRDDGGETRAWNIERDDFEEVNNDERDGIETCEEAVEKRDK